MWLIKQWQNVWQSYFLSYQSDLPINDSWIRQSTMSFTVLFCSRQNKFVSRWDIIIKIRTVQKSLTSRFEEAGEIVAMMDVFVRPPSESCRRRVNLLSLNTSNISIIILISSLLTIIHAKWKIFKIHPLHWIIYFSVKNVLKLKLQFLITESPNECYH